MEAGDSSKETRRGAQPTCIAPLEIIYNQLLF